MKREVGFTLRLTEEELAQLRANALDDMRSANSYIRYLILKDTMERQKIEFPQKKRQAEYV